MNNPKVAVLLAAYNGHRWLEEQVASILQQESVDVTLYVSVDKSSDGTEALVDSLASSDDRIKVLAHGQRFGGAARNFYRLVKDVDVSSFDFTCFADQDDIWNRDKLLRAANAISAFKVHAYSSNVMAFWADGRRQLITKSQTQVQYDYLFEAAGPGCTYVFQRDLMVAIRTQICAQWEQVQQVTLHDWYCYAFSRASGYRWYIDPEPSMLYRQHEKNQVGINSGLGAFKRRIAQVADGWWLTQSRLIASLVGMKDEKFVRSWFDLKRSSLAVLALSGGKCRRRLRDKVAFSLFCLLLVMLPGRREQ